MSTALYRKYRSRKLSDIVGQEHITKTLENAIKNNRISHAYLLTGPRGVGKTSIARILAHEINKLPYTDESTHLDIIEIDAASNRRIDEIRDLRDKVHIAPTSSKYKVYIIDEVHMLTREAFNALLKTLEEPPQHVVFILATTEIHKLPDTIISRTQRFTFKSIDQEKAVKHLSSIAKSEGIKVDKQALELLAIHGNGSFRDSISLLDQVRSSGETITRSAVEKLIGIAADEHIDRLVHSVTAGELSDIATALDAVVEDGINPARIAKQLSSRLRDMAIQGNANPSTIHLLSDLISVPASADPYARLEIALFNANLNINSPQSAASAAPVAAAVRPTSVPQPSQATPEFSAPLTSQATQTPTVDESPQADNRPTNQLADDQDIVSEETVSGPVPELSVWWDDVLDRIKADNNTLHSVLRMAEASLTDNTLNLVFKFMLHQKKVADPVNQSKIQNAIKQVTGMPVAIKSTHSKDGGASASETTAPTVSADNVPSNESESTIKENVNSSNDNPALSNIANIFGGAEVIES